jgi:hypothetical protein
LANAAQATIVTQTFNYTGSIDTFTVPGNAAIVITVTAIGAAGGSSASAPVKVGGRGASITASFNTFGGTQMSVLVGQKGSNGSGLVGAGRRPAVATSTPA